VRRSSRARHRAPGDPRDKAASLGPSTSQRRAARHRRSGRHGGPGHRGDVVAPPGAAYEHRPGRARGSDAAAGRLVASAGRRLGLGDFPEGVAVSPDGVLAVASGVGDGDGTRHGHFGDLCVDGQHRGLFPASSRLGTATTLPDAALFVTNLNTGEFTAVRTPKGRCNPSAAATVTTLHCQELGLVFSPDGRHLDATGGGNDAMMDFAVSTADVAGAAGPLPVPGHPGRLQPHSRGRGEPDDHARRAVAHRRPGQQHQGNRGRAGAWSTQRATAHDRVPAGPRARRGAGPGPGSLRLAAAPAALRLGTPEPG